MIGAYRMIVIVLLWSVHLRGRHTVGVLVRTLRYRLNLHLIHDPLHLIHHRQLGRRRWAVVLLFNFVNSQSIGLVMILLRSIVC